MDGDGVGTDADSPVSRRAGLVGDDYSPSSFRLYLAFRSSTRHSGTGPRPKLLASVSPCCWEVIVGARSKYAPVRPNPGTGPASSHTPGNSRRSGTGSGSFAGRAGRPDRLTSGGPQAPRRRTLQPRDRRGSLHQCQDRQRPPFQYLPEAGGDQPVAGCCSGPAAGTGRPRLSRWVDPNPAIGRRCQSSSVCGVTKSRPAGAW